MGYCGVAMVEVEEEALRKEAGLPEASILLMGFVDGAGTW